METLSTASELSLREFYIAGLPRSRTAWLATTFCTMHSFCFHEALARFGHIPDRPERYRGTVETRVELLPKDGRRVLIHSDPNESIDGTIRNFNVPRDLRGPLAQVIRDSAGVMARADGLHVQLGEIDDRLDEIWEYVLPDIPVDRVKLSEMKRLRVKLKGRTLEEIR